MRGSARLTFGLLALLFVGSASALDYQVRRGDTLSTIASRFGVSVDQLRAANNLRGSTIIAGQTLRIPIASAEHVVASGEVLWTIALRYRVTAAEIMRVNGLRSDVIHPGQRLRIPGVTGATTTSTSSTTARPAPSAPAPSTTARSTPSAATSTSRPPTSTSSTSSSTGPRTNPAVNLTAAELEILARIIKGECPPDVPWEGKVAVAAVVLNRVRHPGFPSTVRAVAHQPAQFSCYNPRMRARLYNGPVPQWCYDAARAAARGEDPSRGATHYFNPHLVRPAWARNMRFIRRIGTTRSTTHDFYR
ncbi:MAG: LysM peptidoglycan-binding domain-containing protein [Planctomycetes bacterium]|nr:LysM peptidoglycan-binding domain-containing protein [Planctomycetota bacterium]